MSAVVRGSLDSLGDGLAGVAEPAEAAGEQLEVADVAGDEDHALASRQRGLGEQARRPRASST